MPDPLSGYATTQLVGEVLLLVPPEAEVPHAVDDDRNLHHVVPAYVPFAIAARGAGQRAVADLGVRTRRVGGARRDARDWPLASADEASGIAQVEVPGLAPGPYRLLVTRAATRQLQVGPLRSWTDDTPTRARHV